MFCSNCGKEIAEGAKFCANCGAKCAPNAVNINNEPQERRQNPQEKIENAKENETKFNGKKLLFIPIIIGIVLAIFLFTQKKDSVLTITNVSMQDTVDGNVEVFLELANTSKVAIKSVTIGFLAWDEEGSPLSVSTDVLFSRYFDEDHIPTANIMPNDVGEVCVEFWSDVSYIRYFMPVILRYTDYDGKYWENPDSDEYSNLAGQVLSDFEHPNLVEMESALSTSDNNDEYIFADSNKRLLEKDELLDLTQDEVFYAFYEIPARLGAIFEEELLNEYFYSKSWYDPSIKYDDIQGHMLNDYELTNLTLISEYMEEIFPEGYDNSTLEGDPVEKNDISGMYEIIFGSDGGATLEIWIDSESDVYRATFGGSLGINSGFTMGYLVAYTDGTDGIWDYYEDGAIEAGNYEPSMRLYYDGFGNVVVECLDGNSFGGTGFPGFSGEYVVVAE